MPLPNGVTPFGAIEATCPNAKWLGNRGILHTADGKIVKQWDRKAWVTCELRYGNRNRRPLMQPGRYSELFFLDEATALAAGHRPCGECRHARYIDFKAAWMRAHHSACGIGDIDRMLHSDRIAENRQKRMHISSIVELPVGVVFEREGEPFLITNAGVRRWSATGYLPLEPIEDAFEVVNVLTPRSLVDVIRAGYSPEMHPSTG